MSDEIAQEDRGGAPPQTPAELQAAAARAAARYDWETVIALTTQALARPDLLPEAAYELLDLRSTAHRFVAHLGAQQADEERMAALAREMGDLRRQIDVATRQVETLSFVGDAAAGRRLAGVTRDMAEQSGDPRAHALSLLTRAIVEGLIDAELSRGREYCESALRLCQDLEDEPRQALCQRVRFYLELRSGGPAGAQAAAQRGLEFSRRAGDREGEAFALSGLALATADRARQRAYWEQALAIAEAIGQRDQQMRLINNLANVYRRLGLYARAIDYAEQAVALARERQSRGHLAYFLDTLARVYLALGQLERAEELFLEGLAASQEIGDRWVEACYPLGLGWVALARGRPAEARAFFESAAEEWGEFGLVADQAVALAWEGAAHLASGDTAAAQEATGQAVPLVEEGHVTTEYDVQDVWWWRYRALKATPHPQPPLPQGERGGGAVSPPLEEGAPTAEPPGGEGGALAWRALDKAREAMVAAVATLSDDGLRRNYFNKIAVNRAMIEAWLEEADQRGLALAPLTDHLSGPTSAEDQLKRMLDIGVRLNARRETGELPGPILDEVVELTGAERAALMSADDVGSRRLAAASVMGKLVPADGCGDDQDALGWLADASVLLDEVGEKRVPILRHVPADTPELEQTSRLCVPLVVQGRLVGLVYCELGGHYGRFMGRDRDLLSVLANQAAVALENASWAQTLERRVDERTAELQAATAELRASNAGLEERTAELEIINSIGQGLAKQLDFQAIIDLVGDRIREIFVADTTSIFLYDRQTNVVRCPYSVEGGYRGESEPFPLGPGLTSTVIESRQPLLVATWEQAMALGARRVYIDPANLDEAHTEAYLGVPIFAGDDVIGVVDVQSYRQYAYDEADLRLLSTIAANMGVALENARLFDETNRLLDETRQRNAELALINTIQQGLAAQLDTQAIIDLVGDKLREIFTGQNVMVALYDRDARTITVPYWVQSGGYRIHAEPMELGPGLTSKVIASRQPLLVGTVEEMEALGVVYVDNGEPDTPASWLGVPIVVGSEVTGVISLQDWPKNRYSENDARLLSTLASSMAVALENARLFDETNRLLEETRQRNAELAIINTVQQGLAAQLEEQAIYDLVGEKVRDIFDAQVVQIASYDRETELIHWRYEIEKGQRYHSAPNAPQGFSGHVLQTRQPLLINRDLDSRAVELGSTILAGDRPKSYLGVPLLVGGEARGVVALQNIDREDAFSESAVRLLSTLASSMSVALENARLFDEANRLLEETRQRNAELALINTIQQGLAAKLDAQAIIDLVGDKLREIFGGQVTFIALYDEATRLISIPYWVGDEGERITTAPMELGTGLTSLVIESRQPVVFGEYAQQMTAGAVAVDDEIMESWLGVPILVGETVTGVMSLQDRPKNRYGESDVRLLSTLASSMAVALENARLFDETTRLLEETRQRAAELEIINSVSRDLAAQLDVQAIYDVVGEKLREVFDAQVVQVASYDREAHLIHWRYHIEKGERDSPAPNPPTGFSGHILRAREPLLINRDMERRATEFDSTILVGEMPRSYLGVPLLIGGEARGVIALQNVDHEDAFSPSDVRLLTTLSATLAVALENARLFDESQRRAHEMATVADVGREISATLDMTSVLERIAERLHALFRAHDTVLRLVDPDGVTFRTLVALGKYADQFRADTTVLGRGIAGSIAQTGVAEVIEDTAKDPRGVHIAGTPDEEEEPFTLMCAPLIARGRTIGLLQLFRPQAAGVFTQADLSFLVALARQAAIAVENARLFEAAQESQRRMADIIEFLPDPTLVIDRDGRVIAWNRAIEEMTGVKAADMLGKGDYEYAVPFYAERRPILIDLVLLPDDEIEKRYAHLHRDGATLVGEALVPRLQGKPAYLFATASALRNSKGELVGAIETIRDITDRKRAEEELHEAKAAAEAANQSKSAFLAMMSHEIRTPMNAIIGMSGLLLDTELDPDQRDFAETVRASGDALLTIINDILDFSKIEAGKMDMEEQPFDLRECIEESLDLVRLRAAEKGLELAYQVADEAPAGIVGDVTRLRQVLVNLLNNAVKFTEVGEVVLSVDGAQAPGPSDDGQRGDWLLHFSVRDTGIGIPPDRIGRLFQAFTQVDASTSRRYGGTGLGLAVSKRLVEMMGGTLWAESTGVAGEGSTFHFTVRTRPAPAVRARPHLRGEHPQLRGKRLLIVDDNATNRRILTLQTRAWGMVPEDTGSAHEALEWVRRGDPFDVAILDLRMDEMDGDALATEIRRLRDAESLPLVLSSSLGPREAGAPREAFAAFLVKPIRPSALFDALMTIFGAEVVAAAPAGRPRPSVDAEMAVRHPLRILVAEDNAVNQKLALRLLSQMGYRADVAANGLEAIQALERQPYDVILMDVQMPEMDGLEASRQIRSRWPSDRQPHIIAMTANVMEGDRELCLEAGMDDYVGKPVRVDELVSALASAHVRPDQVSV